MGENGMLLVLQDQVFVASVAGWQRVTPDLQGCVGL